MARFRFALILAILVSKGSANKIRLSFSSSPKVTNISIPDDVDPTQGMALTIEIDHPADLEGEGLKNDSVEKTASSETGNVHVSASVGDGTSKDWMESVSGATNGTLPLCFDSENLENVEYIIITSSSDLPSDRRLSFGVVQYDCDGYVTAVINNNDSTSTTWVIVVIIPMLIGFLVLLSIIIVIFYFGFFKKRAKDDLEGNPQGNCCECACDCCCPLLKRRKKRYSHSPVQENKNNLAIVNETPKSMQTPLENLSVEVLPLTSAENTPEKKNQSHQSLESSTVALSPIKVVIPTHIPPSGPIVTPLLQKSIFYKAIQSSPANSNLLDLNRAKKNLPVVLTQKSPQDLKRISGDFSQHNITGHQTVETMVEKIEKEKSPAKVSVSFTHPNSPSNESKVIHQMVLTDSDKKEPFRIIQNPLDLEPAMATPDLPPKMSGMIAPSLPPKHAVIEKEPSPELPPKTKSNEKEKEESKYDAPKNKFELPLATMAAETEAPKISRVISAPVNIIQEENELSSEESKSPRETKAISPDPLIINQINQEKMESPKETKAISRDPSMNRIFSEISAIDRLKKEFPKEISPVKVESPSEIISTDLFYNQVTPEREELTLNIKAISPILSTGHISENERSQIEIKTISPILVTSHISEKEESPTEIKNISPILSTSQMSEKEKSPMEIKLTSPILSSSQISERGNSPMEVQQTSPILSTSQTSEKEYSPMEMKATPIMSTSQISEKGHSPMEMKPTSPILSTSQNTKKEESPMEIKAISPVMSASQNDDLPAPIYPDPSNNWKPSEKEQLPQEQIKMYVPDETGQAIRSRLLPAPLTPEENLMDPVEPSCNSPELVSPLSTEASGSPENQVLSLVDLVDLPPPSMMSEEPLAAMVLCDLPPPIGLSSPQRTPDLSSSSYSNESHEEDEIRIKQPQQEPLINLPDLSPILPNPDKTIQLSPILPPPDLSSSSSSEEGGDDDDEEKEDEDEEEEDGDEDEGKETEKEEEEEDYEEEEEEEEEEEDDDEDDEEDDGNQPTKSIPTSTDLGLDPTMDELADMMREAGASDHDLENCIPNKQTGEKIREVDPIEIEQLVNVMGRANLEETVLPEERVTLEESTKPEESSSTKQQLSPTDPMHLTLDQQQRE